MLWVENSRDESNVFSSFDIISGFNKTKISSREYVFVVNGL